MRRALAAAGAVLLGVLLLTGRVSCGVSVHNGATDPRRQVVRPGDSPGVLPASAGGLTRDRATETRVAGTMADLQAQLPTGAVAGDSLAYAVYRAAKDDPHTGRPAGEVLFVGGTTGERATLLALLRGRADRPGGTVTDIDPGAGGGDGLCTAVPEAGVTVAECAWVTDTSFGELLPLIPTTGPAPVTPTVPQLAALLRQMRPDLDRTTATPSK
jgi:hypothetical protein